MRTFDQLTREEQRDAEDRALKELLEAVVSGVRFNDELNGDDLQARIDAAGEKANEMQTPWFWHEYIMETCEDELRSMARADAEDAVYPANDERVIHLNS